MASDISKELTFLRNIPGIGPYLGRAIEGLMTDISSLGQNSSTDSNVTLPPPPPIQGLSVKTDGNGNVHAVINDSAALQKNTDYFVEIANDASFSQPHVIHLGPSRTMKPMPLPAFDDNGNPQSWHFRGFKQQPGGQPSTPVNFGGTAPTPVNVGGTARLTLIPSTGSGTGQSTGQQGGVGFGKTLFRPSPGPKRRAAS